MRISFLLLSFLLLFSLTGSAQTIAPSHEIFNRLLRKNVSIEGQVNYKAFIKDSIEFNTYLSLLSRTPPDERTWSRNEQLVFWINAYNAFTIKLVMNYYPIKSIKDIGSLIQIPFVNTPWTMKFFSIGKEKMSLDHIEHGILRKRFNDPRIHMTLVCASKSCPILLNEAYDSQRINEQMARQAKAFLADSFRNKISSDKAQISMIFKWYGMDFNNQGSSVISFINTYSDVKIKPKASISFLDYDWNLNE